MKVTFLGTGTSQGIPVIGCNCDACTSEDSRDKRLRSSVFIESKGVNICIDVGPDFRQQMLANKIVDINAVFLTHEHNDHVIGVDDLRPFNFMQKRDMPIYGEQRVLDELRFRFKYAFEPHPYPGIPRFLLNPISPEEAFRVQGINIIPIRINHGSLPIIGYRIGKFAYLTDVKTIPEEEFEKLENLEVVVLSALRNGNHHSHMTIEEAILMSKRIGAQKTFFTHFSHDLGPVSEWEVNLPDNIYPAYDMLSITLSS